MGFVLTDADERKLVGVNARLVSVVRLVAATGSTRFMVVEGVRTKTRQRRLVAEGKSKTMNSKHLVGRAVDIAPLIEDRLSWQWRHFTPLVSWAKTCAASLNVPMEFGYDWGWDAPHWELKDNA